VFQLIGKWLNGDLAGCKDIFSKYNNYWLLEEQKGGRVHQIFYKYILSLCIHWESNQHLYKIKEHSHTLTVIGESHSLSPHLATFKLGDAIYRAQSAFVMGCKMFHLGAKNTTIYQAEVSDHLKAISPSSAVMFTIGEIDCRPDEGIWQVAKKKGSNVLNLVRETVDNYLDFISSQTSKHEFSKIIIQGVPAPAYSLTEKQDPRDAAGFLQMIRAVNERLKEGAEGYGWKFLDVYRATANPFGTSNKKWHLDGWHLKPSFYQEADQWLS
jgi:hypothetical protein